MKSHIETSKGFEEEKRLEEEAFLRLNDSKRFRVSCELSEIMLQIQFENGILPEDINYILRK